MVTDSSFNSTVRSKTAGEVCLRFDQASVTSSAQASAVPLRVFTGLHGGPAVKQVMRGPERDRSKSFAPPRVCFTQKQTDFFWFKPDLSELFPNQRMFNAISSQGSVDPRERGIGHWLSMTVPVEYDGKRETIEMRLTATDSHTKLVVGF
jgi:hypothetical protein